jgi:hypothetical protein
MINANIKRHALFKRIAMIAAAIFLCAITTAARAQTAQDNTAHHPDTAAPTVPTPGGWSGTMPGMGMMPGGSDMGAMMQSMMPMMRMMMAQDMMRQMRGSMRMMPFTHVEGRIAFLKVELGITEAQLPQWNAFADALRAGVMNMQQIMDKLTHDGMPTAAPARAQVMVQIMSARLDGMKAMLAAGQALYDVLSDDQKKIADALMSERGQMMGMGL